jgi:RND family efflux transporter MFP subunit
MRDQQLQKTSIHSLRATSLVVTGALVLALGACKRNTAKAADASSAQLTVGTENIAIARIGTVTNGPAISGSIEPELDATIRAQVPGSVLSTSAEVGQAVRKGQQLAQLDAGGLQDAYLSARSAVASAQSTNEVARRNLARSQTLLQAGAIAQRDLETAQTQASSAAAALSDARARLAAAQKNFENTRIIAPFTGVVSQKSVSAGDVVQPGTAIYTVVDPTTMRLEASVPSDQLTLVHVGTDVTFNVTGLANREFHGRVTRVSPAVDPTTRQVQIIVSIPNTSHTLVAGLYADGRVSSSTRQGVVVPNAAVDLRMQRPAVLRVHDGKVERVDVALGLHDPTTETVEIASGVQPGDTLLLGQAQAITPGTPVKVEPPPSDASVGAAGAGGPASGGTSAGGNGTASGGANGGTGAGGMGASQPMTSPPASSNGDQTTNRPSAGSRGGNPRS